MKNTPICSVVMAVYNGEETLKEAIDSILNQTLKEFEFIIVDDASTDKTESIIKSYDDPRIRYVKNHENKYLGPSLNEGIKIANGKYIVRMDADDISYSNRLMVQYEFMEANPSIGIAGSWADIFGINTGELIYETNNFEIKLKLLFECHILHPSIIIRKSLIDNNQLFYDPVLQHSEDYDFFVRAFKLTDFANIDKKLINYRSTITSETRETDEFRNKFYNQTKLDLFRMMGVEINQNELMLFRRINHQIFSCLSSDIHAVNDLLTKMVNGNNRTLLFETKPFQSHIAELFENVCRNSNKSALSAFSIYKKSRLRDNSIIKTKITLILFLKIILSIFRK
jgi:glycosyltransferase involved in cell wall biosynthesis